MQEVFSCNMQKKWLVLVCFLMMWCVDWSTSIPVREVAREPGMRPNTYFYHVEDGLHYHRSSTRRNRGRSTLYFKCVRYAKRCRGRAAFTLRRGFLHTQEHNHQPDMLYPQEMALRRNILARCRNLDYASLGTIIQEESAGFPVEVRSRITEARMRTSMRNARAANYPPLPETLQGVTAILRNPAYRVITQTEDGLDNFYGGSVTDGNGHHHILMISERMVEAMRSFRALHSDGTFKVVPPGLNIEQVFTIVAVWDHRVIPLGWAFMESRTEIAYRALFQLLHNQLGMNIELERAITDFEPAQQNAWEAEFGVSTTGCLWHLCRRFIHVCGELGLIGFMRNIPQVKRIIRLCMGLPLLRRDLIRRGLVLIVRVAQAEGGFIFNAVTPFLQYVNQFWVGRRQQRRRMCVYASRARTNNACECHNRCLRGAVGVHPNLYRFIDGIRTLEQQSVDILHRLQNGLNAGRGRRASSINNDERIMNLSRGLENPPGPLDHAIIRFLNAVSHVMDNIVDEAFQ